MKNLLVNDERPIVIVGASGVVGLELLSILAQRGVPADRLRPLASERSAGAVLAYGKERLVVDQLNHQAVAGAGMVFLCASAEVSRDIAPIAIAAGALVIDNSSAFRLHASVPLVVPEINSERLPRSAQGALIANPNCSTIILLTALEPLRRKFGIRSIHVSTYQAVSGAGQRGMDELLKQVHDFAQGKTSSPVAFAEPCLFNVFSHDSEVDEQTGLNGEEQKIIDESRKIWSDPALAITPTCVRVPVLRAHTQAISIELQEPATHRELQDAWGSSAAVRVIDNRAANKFPTPLQATGSDAVLVGRLRADHAGLSAPSRPHPSRTTRWSLLACGDQLRKGAALNAVQIAEQIQF